MDCDVAFLGFKGRAGSICCLGKIDKLYAVGVGYKNLSDLTDLGVDESELFLAPLFQCCTLRRTTYEKLSPFKTTAVFVQQLQNLLKTDRLPILLDKDWFNAFERRLEYIFKIIEKCADANGGLDSILV